MRFSGEPAKEPIRVYVGLDSASTAQERAALAVQELERTGAFDRKLLVDLVVDAKVVQSWAGAK